LAAAAALALACTSRDRRQQARSAHCASDL